MFGVRGKPLSFPRVSLGLSSTSPTSTCTHSFHPFLFFFFFLFRQKFCMPRASNRKEKGRIFLSFQRKKSRIKDTKARKKKGKRGRKEKKEKERKKLQREGGEPRSVGGEGILADIMYRVRAIRLLKKQCWLNTSNEPAAGHRGMRQRRRISLDNLPFRCRGEREEATGSCGSSLPVLSSTREKRLAVGATTGRNKE